MGNFAKIAKYLRHNVGEISAWRILRVGSRSDWISYVHYEVHSHWLRWWLWNILNYFEYFRMNFVSTTQETHNWYVRRVLSPQHITSNLTRKNLTRKTVFITLGNAKKLTENQWLKVHKPHLRKSPPRRFSNSVSLMTQPAKLCSLTYFCCIVTCRCGGSQ